jgi:eukaryotic-like serine/threonine-protein kinase
MPRYASRSLAAVGVVAALTIAMIAAFVSWTNETSRYARERERMAQELERANRERARAERVAELMTGIFRLDDPLNERASTITARETLDQAAYDASVNLAKDPDIQSQVMYLVARSYLNLGLTNSANRTAQMALDARRKLYGPDDPRTLESMAQLGWILGHQGQGIEAQRIDRETLERQRRKLGDDNEQTLRTMRQLAIIDGMLGDHEEQKRLLQQIAATRTEQR